MIVYDIFQNVNTNKSEYKLIYLNLLTESLIWILYMVSRNNGSYIEALLNKDTWFNGAFMKLTTWYNTVKFGAFVMLHIIPYMWTFIDLLSPLLLQDYIYARVSTPF